MSNTRKNGIDYLREKIEGDLPSLISASKLYEADESWTGNPAWWFDLTIDKISQNEDKEWYLLCEVYGDKFHIFRVPNKFLLDHIKAFETKYNDAIRLHLSAEESNLFVDQRGQGKIDLSEFLLEP